jgi:predicted amidohydrolase
MRVALLQIRVDDQEPVAARIERVMTLMENVADGRDLDVPVIAADGTAPLGRPDFMVLPELWTVGAFNMQAARENPVSIEGELLGRVGALARSRRMVVHAGSFPEFSGGDRYNTAVVLGDDGSIRARYRKIHLFGFDSGEARELTAGTDECVVETPLGVTGLATCYDLRFPELFRRLTANGASAFALASGWPLARIDHWRVLLQARAIENQSWVVGCNQVGTHSGVVLGGQSSVIDPRGGVVVEAPTDAECVVVADISPEASYEARQEFPVLRDRRL